jgi:aryl-alcohol dehydrogenase-like predicted oxidoreductase
LGGDFGPVSGAKSREILEAADKAGINFRDTADVYGGGMSESRIEQYVYDKTGESQCLILL